jgi:hypothetical protein
MPYITEDELQYIQNVGLTLEKVRRKKLMTHRQWLEKYLTAAALRVDWGEIDRERIIRFALSEIAHYE